MGPYILNHNTLFSKNFIINHQTEIEFMHKHIDFFTQINSNHLKEHFMFIELCAQARKQDTISITLIFIIKN
jgi:hypothetical protein